MYKVHAVFLCVKCSASSHNVCLLCPLSPQAHSGSSQPAAHLEQTTAQRPGHQKDPRRDPAGAVQRALQVPCGGRLHQTLVVDLQAIKLQVLFFLPFYFCCIILDLCLRLVIQIRSILFLPPGETSDGLCGEESCGRWLSHER